MKKETLHVTVEYEIEYETQAGRKAILKEINPYDSVVAFSTDERGHYSYQSGNVISIKKKG